MRIALEYYAILREMAGRNTEELELVVSTPADVYTHLAAKYGFHISQARLRVAVNDSFVDWQHQLEEGDRIVFIPPVAGG